MTRYDLYIGSASAPGTEPEPGSEARQGWLELDLDLEGAREHARRVLGQGGSAYVVPARYRVAKVTSDEAERTAEGVRRRLLDEGRRIAPFAFGIDDLLWWTFVADDLEAVEQDSFPGQVRIAVDKLDGSIRTEEQHQQWLRLTHPARADGPS